MLFRTMVDVEAPVRVAGDVIRLGKMAQLLPRLRSLGLRVQRVGRPESGAWDLDNVQVKYVRLEGEQSRKQFQATVDLLELETHGEVVEVLGVGEHNPLCISFDGTVRYTERHRLTDMAIVTAYVIPIPEFVVVNRRTDSAWFTRSWERVRRRIVSTWGSVSARNRLKKELRHVP